MVRLLAATTSSPPCVGLTRKLAQKETTSIERILMVAHLGWPIIWITFGLDLN
jgi:hypothetical protein